MQKTHEILQAIRKLGVKGTPLTRVYRCLYNPNLYLTAYSKIYSNQGAITPGADEDTLDGMSLKRIHRLIERMKQETFHPTPVRRTRVPKKSGGKRPLGLPNGTDKLVQESLRMLLEAYYEPRFRDSSHGFRPERGCHTALSHIKNKFEGTTWFIEGDIKGCFDNISHDVLLDILKRDIQDGRVTELIRRFLKAGYVEDWEYHKTYSGTPQGGIISPLLSNIYLHELDQYIEDELIPQYTKGKRRATNTTYQYFSERIGKARKRGDMETVRKLEKERRQHPSQKTHDPNYRRLKYCRYADDFILGFIGTREEAEEIKLKIKTFLQERLQLELSDNKTLITHARTQHARFLGYAISIYHANHSLSVRDYDQAKRRNINGVIRLGLPTGLVDERGKAYHSNGKIVSERRLVDGTIPHTIHTYHLRFRGLAQYYKYAVDLHQLGKLDYIMEVALVKTLAHKLRIRVSEVYKRFRSTKVVNEQSYKTLEFKVETRKGTRSYYWGAIPLRTTKVIREPLNDNRGDFENYQYIEKRNDLLKRLAADQCEICGAETDCEVHHVRKLADLKKRWQGRKQPPIWVVRMLTMQRKTLVVCHDCHWKIHNGDPLPQKPISV
jgi:group II intron reverse transcriptase/maturase